MIENAIGGSGGDTIIGNSADNVLKGGARQRHADRRRRQRHFPGHDRRPQWRHDHGFRAGDKIVFTDATLGSFTFQPVGNTLTYTGGSLTFGSGLDGHVRRERRGRGRSSADTRDAATPIPSAGTTTSTATAEAISCGATTVVRSPTGWARPTAASSAMRPKPQSSRPAGTSPAPAISTATAASDILWRNDSGARHRLARHRQMAASSTMTRTFTSALSSELAHGRHRRLQRRRPQRHPVAQRQRHGDRLARPSQRRLRRQRRQRHVSQAPTTGMSSAPATSTATGVDDILWRNDDGEVTDWLGQPTAASSAMTANFTINSAQPAGTSSAPATSTATASTTSCGATTTAPSPTGSARPMAASYGNAANFADQRRDRLARRRDRRLQRRRRDDILWRTRRHADRLARPVQRKLRWEFGPRLVDPTFRHFRTRSSTIRSQLRPKVALGRIRLPSRGLTQFALRMDALPDRCTFNFVDLRRVALIKHKCSV